MQIVYPNGPFTVKTDDGSVLMRACGVCGAVVVETDDTDYAVHLRWHELTSTQNWYDSVAGRTRDGR